MNDYVHEVLDELVPRFDDEPGDWERVVADAGVGTTAYGRTRKRRTPRLTRRRLVLVALVVAALATPLLAAGSRDWWFFRFSDPTFAPVTDVSVVRTGTWDGEPWELSAYLSANGVCFSLTPTSASRPPGEGAALACAWIEGLPDVAAPPSDWQRLTITLLAGSSIGFPAYVVGPVVDSADEVAIHLADGTVLRTPTFDAPDELGSIRFYATQRPEPARVPGVVPRPNIRKLVGLTSEGEIAACLVLRGEVTRNSACA